MALDDALDFHGRFFQYAVHFLGEIVTLAKQFEGEVSRLLVGQQRALILLEVLILDGNVVQGDNHDSLARLEGVGLTWCHCT